MLQQVAFRQAVHLLPVWRESTLFDGRDRAALEWTECLTRLPDGGVPDAAFDTVRAVFTEEEIGQLTVAIGTINLWNRIGVSSRMPHLIDPPPERLRPAC